jgi:hypothetical protein
MSGVLSATTTNHGVDQSARIGSGDVEFPREVVDVVVNGIQAVTAGVDEEVVECHVEGARSRSPRQAARADLVNDEQQPSARSQLHCRLA